MEQNNLTKQELCALITVNLIVQRLENDTITLRLSTVRDVVGSGTTYKSAIRSLAMNIVDYVESLSMFVGNEEADKSNNFTRSLVVDLMKVVHFQGLDVDQATFKIKQLLSLVLKSEKEAYNKAG